MRANRRIVLFSLPQIERRPPMICRTISHRVLINELVRKKTRSILASAVAVRARISGSGVQKDRKAVESSIGTAKATSRTCKYPAIQIEKFTDAHAAFLYPSSLFKGIQNARFIPSTFRKAGAVQDFVTVNPSDFWEKAKQSEKTLREYVYRLLGTAATYFKSTKFTDIASAMNQIVRVTSIFRVNIQGTLDAHHITLDAVTKELEKVFTAVVNQLEKFPPTDKAPGHAGRAEMVGQVLDGATEALVELAMRYGIEEQVVTSYLHALKPQVQALMVTIGDINEQYPRLLPALSFSVAILLIRESWLLKPLLSSFGFGPTGPVKGSPAAWLQKRLWGTTVKANSWFSWLWAAGKGVLPKWALFVAKSPLLTRGALAMFFPYHNFDDDIE